MNTMKKEELLALKEQLEKEYAAVKAKNISLDMSRGKPAAQQLDLSMGIMDCLTSKDTLKAENGTDCRNYGVLDGIPEAKRLMAGLMGVKSENVIVYGNASLQFQEPIPTALWATLLGANLIRLNGFALSLAMTDILPLQSVLALK